MDGYGRRLSRTLRALVVRRCAVFLLSISLSTPWCLYAREADTLSAARVVAVKALPVVRAAEEMKLEGKADVPAQLSDVLQVFTGVQVKDYGGVGGLKTVNVRSLGSEHIGIFLDGIQIDNAQNMQVDLGRFQADGFSSVALYNGQKTRRLQTAKEYASGAAVHLETARPALPDKVVGRVKMRAGSFDTVNPSLSCSAGLGPVALSVCGDFLYSSGRYDFPCFGQTLVRENGDIRSLRLESRLFGNVRGGEWRLHAYAYGSERGFPGPVIRRAAGFPFSAERQSDQDFFVQGGWVQEWNGAYSTSLKLKYANNYTHYATHAEKNPMAFPYDLWYRQQSVYASLAQSYVISDPWSVDLSTDVQWNALDSDVGMFAEPRRTAFTGALSTRYVLDRFRVAAHLIYQGTWDVYKNLEAGAWTRENRYRDAWMPSLSLFWAPLRNFEIDAFVKRSYRLPSFNDLYYRLVGNSDLRPELALQTGADLRYALTSGPWRFDARISPYYNRVSDKILAIPTTSQFRWTMLNIGIVDIFGLDVRLTAAWAAGDWSASATTRYSLQRAMDHSTPGSSVWGNQIPYIPVHSGSIDLSLGWRKWRLHAGSVFTGERWSRTANIPDYRVAPWSVTDLSLSKTFSFPALRGRSTVPELSLGVVCRNIFDRHYEIVQGYPMPGFNASLSIEFNW
ncbi:MAG: TonB-dependent receptor [Bacteroidales bacterium]|nr:TonB-dependent receptor [Bacteroidales bacterium]